MNARILSGIGIAAQAVSIGATLLGKWVADQKQVDLIKELVKKELSK